jgi:plastocyanin
MSNGRSILRSAMVTMIGLLVALTAMPVRAENDGPTGSGPPSRVEFAKLQADVREQRELIIQMLQTEQQRYDMLLRLLSGQGGGAPMVNLPLPSDAPATPTAETSSRRARAEVERKSGAIEGKVSLPGGDLEDVYVYVENARGPAVHSKTIEIRQEGKQFSPRVAVVQAGTSVAFPNLDSIYHNVFSTSPRNSFDLGSYRSGDKVRTVTMTSPGVVEIFCNMHQKMSADVLVVPNGFYTKVHADGTFRLDNVPAGPRKVVAWSPRAKPAQQKVDVTGAVNQVSFVLSPRPPAAHANKMGQAYGSYRE